MKLRVEVRIHRRTMTSRTQQTAVRGPVSRGFLHAIDATHCLTPRADQPVVGQGIRRVKRPALVLALRPWRTLQPFPAIHAVGTMRLRRVQVDAHPFRLAALNRETVVRFAVRTRIIRQLSAHDPRDRADGQSDFRTLQRAEIAHRDDHFVLANITGELKRSARGSLFRSFRPRPKAHDPQHQYQARDKSRPRWNGPLR